ncbi:ubiquinol oxidase 1, mitochondrial-like [Mangifera indica]|uniref:ubiquinol oxidase 1, mitochondrial-like n=1 Tax=Mangifera indica TaxID=29780 RepID=UPI001CF9CCE3|nr:ubiquinol oxidase 1, mitochondrial-like [Mangifera indica]
MSSLAVSGPRLFSSVTTRTVSGESVATYILTGYSKLAIAGVKYSRNLALHVKEREKKQKATVTTGDGSNNEEKRSVSYDYRLGIGVEYRRNLALHEKDQKENQEATETTGDGNTNEEKRILSYWGLETPKFTKEDGIEWRWNFRVHRSDLLLILQSPATFCY